MIGKDSSVCHRSLSGRVRRTRELSADPVTRRVLPRPTARR
ncbi:MAG: hypothetical protein AVDCRST_MAG54-895 [uncultured Actinomycetospora sp.]|uniref:Uncharacterized protein n=1 Tax=uncultured Actinomycetospora sp. TaxID=1135996 RepID=A0A6J4HM81_9PSEU|nr:MAG: hypothetical protein AVDCRST_MAG54-895 [uncultured Actinomycetospora sp.]